MKPDAVITPGSAGRTVGAADSNAIEYVRIVLSIVTRGGGGRCCWSWAGPL